MVRAVVAMCALAGCGRFGFADHSAADAPRADAPDAAHDAAIDGTPLPAGLIAWWPMDDDPTDGTIDDIAGGHDAQCATGVSCPTSVPGKHGNALHVDGTQYAL